MFVNNFIYKLVLNTIFSQTLNCDATRGLLPQLKREEHFEFMLIAALNLKATARGCTTAGLLTAKHAFQNHDDIVHTKSLPVP
jgi:hypothetical protein